MSSSTPYANRVGLVREAGGLGDVIRLDSVARAVKSRGAQRVTVFGLKQYRDVVKHLESVDHFEPLSPPPQGRRSRQYEGIDSSRFPYLAAATESGLCDVLLDMFCPANTYELRCEGPVELDRIDLFCREAGVAVPADAAPRWVVLEEETEHVLPYRQAFDKARKLVVLSRRSLDPARAYSPAQSLELIHRLYDEGYQVLEVDDQPSEIPSNPSRTLVNFPLPLLAALMKMADVLVSVDNGIYHLAASLGLPTVGLFGPTEPEIMARHYRTHTHVLPYGYRGEVASPCQQPCYFRESHGWRPEECRPKGCWWLNRIDPQDVVKKVKEVLFDD